MTTETAGPRFSARRIQVLAAVLVVGAVVAVLVWRHFSTRTSTDDAQIDAHITQIAARVGGTVARVAVTDNQSVSAGAVLIEIDPREYQIAVQRAEAELAAAQASAAAAASGVPIARTEATSGVSSASGSVEQASAGIGAADSGIETARAHLRASQAVLKQRAAEAERASRDLARLEGLIQKDEIPRQQYDAAVAAAAAARAAADAAEATVAESQTAVATAESRARQARADLSRANASLQVARTAPDQIRVTRAQADVAQARVQQAEAALAQARLDLQHTRIVAPAAGIVSRRTVEHGQVVQPGQPLLALVDLDGLWVTANFKETQLSRIRAGQRVEVEVDALGGQRFAGHVDSIAAATGARFSLLPPENATGNYVKVVQRVPVKIALEHGQDACHRLRPGMSVVPTVFFR